MDASEIFNARARIEARAAELARQEEQERIRKEQAEALALVQYFEALGIYGGDVIRLPELPSPAVEFTIMSSTVRCRRGSNGVGDEIVTVYGDAGVSMLTRDGESDAVWGDLILDAMGRAAGL